MSACRPRGKVIFYTYSDVLLALRIVNLLKFKWIGWVGDLLPKWLAGSLERIDHKEVSVGVYKCCLSTDHYNIAKKKDIVGNHNHAGKK